MRVAKVVEALSRVPVHVTMKRDEIDLAIGTAFPWLRDGQTFLVTAWHNLTGVDPLTGMCLHSQGGLPNRIAIHVHDANHFGRWRILTVPLYHPLTGDCLWLEHPQFGNKIDVAVVPMPERTEVRWFPINGNEFDSFQLEPGLDVYVLGFPKGIGGGGKLPVWKRGSIATEPDVDIDGLPKVLIDTATREGLSGAPVVAQITGVWLPEGVTDRAQQEIGRGRRLLGIYTGRVGKKQFEAQLGIVWKPDVVEQIISGGTLGEHPLLSGSTEV